MNLSEGNSDLENFSKGHQFNTKATASVINHGRWLPGAIVAFSKGNLKREESENIYYTLFYHKKTMEVIETQPAHGGFIKTYFKNEV